MEIIPAILPKNYEDLKEKLSKVRSLVDVVQVDICDGVFVPSITWPFYGKGNKGTALFKKSSSEEINIVSDGEEIVVNKEEDDDYAIYSEDVDEHFRKILNEEEGMPYWQDLEFEIDLMVSDAVENFDLYSKLGPKRMIFHFESFENADDFLEFLQGIDIYIREFIDIGVAINPKTKIEKIFPLINEIDFVQVMGIEKVGFQGQDFSQKAIDHIKTLRKKYPDLTISVDGGVSLETAPLLIDAGVSRLVSGSAIFNSQDIIGTIEEFESL